MRTRPGKRLRGAAGMATIALVAASGVAAFGSETTAAAAPPSSACQLGNGVKHVVSLVFDNVHFFRDNPNVPSDLEQMPHLLNFLKSNGTVLSNVHTPLIAHTADDSLTIYTGLYGDRHGQPVSNSYKTYNPDGTTDPATSFAYWTAPVSDTKNPPTSGHDTTPSMVYSDTVPAPPVAPDRQRQTPAPWVPFTRAGCTVGDFSTANMVLENVPRDIPAVFGPNSPEAAPGRRRPGLVQGRRGRRLHRRGRALCQGDATCANAQAVKFGQTTPSLTAVEDSLPTEPGGYNGFQGTVRRAVRRAATRGGHAEPRPQRLPDHQRGGQPRRPRPATRSRAVQPASPGSPASARPPRSRSPTWPTCRRPASPSRTATSPTCTSARPTPAGARRRPPQQPATPIGPGDSCYVEERQGIRRRVREVLRATRRGRHHAGQHGVHDRRGGERPVRRRERGPGDPADTGRLRWRHHRVQLRNRSDRRAGCEHQGPALDDIQQRHAVRHRAAGRGDLRARAAGG